MMVTTDERSVEIQQQPGSSGDVMGSDAWHRGYKESMQGVRRRLLQRTAKEGGLLYVAELHGNALVRKMDHLVCFLPGAPFALCCIDVTPLCA